MLKHVVFVKFKKDVPESAIAEIEKGLGELPDIIPEIMQFQFGRDVLRSELSYDFALVSEFENLEALQRYQVHPEHQKVVAKLKEVWESRFVVDFEI
jgi:hypothetical protein